MAIDIEFRRRAVSRLTNEIGVYVLCDLDHVPIYVGQSRDGIRSRVLRHLTSARSDIIANRMVDVWEIAWVWAYPVPLNQLNEFEGNVLHFFNQRNPVMNGSMPPEPEKIFEPPEPDQIIQVMSEVEIVEKRDPTLRLPRQAEHYSSIVGHFLAVKRSPQIARAMDAHFERLTRYHRQLRALAVDRD